MRVDVVIAAHNPARPVARAATSVVAGNPEARCVVVCHNQPERAIRETFPEDVAAACTFLELHDGIPSPSGPFNHGISASTAEFVSIMGSDDRLDAGAVAHWLEVADRWSADAVIPRVMRGQSRSLVRSPAVRPWARGPLDIVRDRLAYRSAPLGLVRRDAVDRLGLQLTPGARNGGDLEFTTRLWVGGRVVYAAAAPGYHEMQDATDRVTFVMKPVAEELGRVADLVALPWFLAQPESVREAVAVKLVRRNVVDAVLKRRDVAWEEREVRDLTAILASIATAAPRVEQLLSSREAALVRAIRAGHATVFATLAEAAKQYRHPAALVGAHLRSVLHPSGALRFALASAAMR